MKCPECTEPMESEQKCGTDYALAGVPTDKKQKSRVYVLVEYFCLRCQDYYFWDRLTGLTKRKI